jgi:hypothetical protein
MGGWNRPLGVECVNEPYISLHALGQFTRSFKVNIWKIPFYARCP